MKKILLGILLVIVLIIAVVVIKLQLFEWNGSKISQGAPIKSYSSEKSALLVVDIQEGITGELAANDDFKKNSESLIQNVNRIIDLCVENQVSVIYVKAEITDRFINLLNNTFEKGGPPAKLDKRLKIVSNLVISKEKQDAFSDPVLDSILIANQINALYIVGLDAAYCVNSTIEAAKNRGYKITVIQDAIVSKTDSLKNVMVSKFKSENIYVINTEEFLKMMKL